MLLTGCLRLTKAVDLNVHHNKTNLAVSTGADAACSEFVQSAWFQVAERVFCS